MEPEFQQIVTEAKEAEATGGRIIELEEKIVEASQAYYLGEQVYSDQEFDEMVEELRSLDPDSHILHAVGWGLRVYGNKVDLPMTIRHSLSKVHKLPQNVGPYLIGSVKIDGMSIIAEYVEGQLKLLVTRGDGVKGIDVTSKAEKIVGLSTNIKSRHHRYVTRGELYIPWSVFNEHLADDYANPRNAVAGIINSKSFDKLEYVHFVQHPYAVDREVLPTLDVYHIPFDTPEEILKEQFDEIVGDYPADGMVVQSLRMYEEGTLDEMWAYKFETEEAEARVTGVEWNETKSGRLVPVVIFEPTPLYGTNNSRASGFNYQFIQKHNINVGSVIRFTKANEIIPYITKVVAQSNEPAKPEGEYDIIGVHAVKVGKEYRRRKMLEYFNHWHHNFDGFKNTSQLLDIFEIKDFEDLIDLKANADESLYDILAENGLRSKAAQIIEKLKSKVSSEHFFSQFGIDGIGPVAAGKIDMVITQPEVSVWVDDFEDMLQHAGVNVRVKNALRDPINLECIREAGDALSEYGMIDHSWRQRKAEEPVTDKKVCITGALSVTKSKFAELLRPAGVKVVGSVNKDLDYLIASDPNSNSGKAKRARDLGVEIITEDQARKMWL